MKILEKVGYSMVRQKGSHMRLMHDTEKTRKPLTIPNHKIIGKGLLHKILRDAEIDLDTFKELLK